MLIVNINRYYLSKAGCPHFKRVWSQMRRITRPNWSQTRILMTFVKEKQISEGRILLFKKLSRKNFRQKMLNFVRKNVKIDYFVKDLQNFVQEAKIEPNSSWSQIRIYGAKPIFKRPNLRNLAPKRPKWPPWHIEEKICHTPYLNSKTPGRLLRDASDASFWRDVAWATPRYFLKCDLCKID